MSKLNGYLKMTYSFKDTFLNQCNIANNPVLHIFYYYLLRDINHNNNKKDHKIVLLLDFVLLSLRFINNIFF